MRLKSMVRYRECIKIKNMEFACYLRKDSATSLRLKFLNFGVYTKNERKRAAELILLERFSTVTILDCITPLTDTLAQIGNRDSTIDTWSNSKPRHGRFN